MPNHLHLMVRIKREEEILAALRKRVATLQGFETLGGFSKAISLQLSRLFNAYTQAYNKIYKGKAACLSRTSRGNWLTLTVHFLNRWFTSIRIPSNTDSTEVEGLYLPFLPQLFRPQAVPSPKRGSAGTVWIERKSKSLESFGKASRQNRMEQWITSSDTKSEVITQKIEGS